MSILDTLKCFQGLQIKCSLQEHEYFCYFKRIKQVKEIVLVSCIDCQKGLQLKFFCTFHPLMRVVLFEAKRREFMSTFTLLKLNTSRPSEDFSCDRITRPLTLPTDCSGRRLICQRLSFNVTARNEYNSTDVVDQRKVLLIFVTHGHYSITKV